MTPRDHALEIVRTLRRHEYQAYLAGGCVRDMLLGHEPTDYDVTTDATPHQVMRVFPETYAVGAQFAVVLVPVPKEGREFDPAGPPHPVEVATFRSDGIYSDGRHPDHVQYTNNYLYLCTFGCGVWTNAPSTGLSVLPQNQRTIPLQMRVYVSASGFPHSSFM